MQAVGFPRRLRFVAAIGIALAVCQFSTINTLAYHAYSIGRDSTSWGGSRYYSGVSVRRYDQPFTLDPDTNCGIPGTHPVAFQAMWLSIDPSGGASARDWVEEGTANQTCTDGTARIWWYGYINNGTTSGYLWQQIISNPTQHRFFLANGSGSGDPTCSHGQGGVLGMVDRPN